MAMIPGYIHYRSSHVRYLHGGKGGNVFVCLHGYGETAESFDLLQQNRDNDFRIVSLDLPFHGETEWNEPTAFTPEDLLLIIKRILEDLSINTKTFSLIGYSMGGRIALAYTEKYTAQVHKLILLAPDGLKLNPWYWLATQTAPGNRLFRFTMQHPGWFMWILHAANRIKLINPGIYKFTKYYIDNPVIRKELVERWTGLRKFRPDLSQLKNELNKHRVKVFMLFGKHDRIILPFRGQQFAKQIPKCRVDILDCGHRLLQQKNNDTILQIMRS